MSRSLESNTLAEPDQQCGQNGVERDQAPAAAPASPSQRKGEFMFISVVCNGGSSGILDTG